jgi:deoxyribose-phosphate aldolase
MVEEPEQGPAGCRLGNPGYRRRMHTYREIAKMIDHSMLAPSTTVAEFEAGIQLALDYDVASVCIVPSYLRRCAERLLGSDVKPSTTIGFPHGGQATAAKAAEARIALDDGAVELDMVVNLHHALSGDWQYVESDVRAVRDATHACGAKLKVIFETCYLNDTQKIRLCEICTELGADWVKTSTGFGTSGATLQDLRLMRRHTPPSVQVKASGGVKDLAFVLAAREIGVTRCGSSRTRALLDECKGRLDAGS